MNILFVLYSDFTSNSAAHIQGLANELVRLGQSCTVAIPYNPHTRERLGQVPFQTVTFAQALQPFPLFPDGGGPDLVHAWTPREIVRRFCSQLSEQYAFRQFIHLEDNEWNILDRISSTPPAQMELMTPAELDYAGLQTLSHPVHGRRFLKEARGVTVIIEKLRELVPEGVPSVVIWPAADSSQFFPRPLPKADGRPLGIPANSTVVVYGGSVHEANAREVRSLYLAIAMLNREGHSAALVRSGRDLCKFLGDDESWVRPFAIELGDQSPREVPALMSLADILVQPGRPGPFNDYRFPSKLPEFFSIGRPVVLPCSNIGLHTRHGVDAYVLDDANGTAIADAIRTIMGDSALYHRLAKGAVRFSGKNFSWAASARKLLDFYATASDGPR